MFYLEILVVYEFYIQICKIFLLQKSKLFCVESKYYNFELIYWECKSIETLEYLNQNIIILCIQVKNYNIHLVKKRVE